jgi:hypothetical protein
MFKSITLLILNSITFMVLNTETTVAIHFHIILLVLCSITFVVPYRITLLIQILPHTARTRESRNNRTKQGYTLNIRGGDGK